MTESSDRSGRRRRLLEWERLIRAWRPPRPPASVERFVTETLGYDCTSFHRRWWEFVRSEPRSLLLAPRGHGKSTIITVAMTIGDLIEDPDMRLLLVSNTRAQAAAFLREIKHHLEGNRRVREICGEPGGTPWTETEIGLAGRIVPAKEPAVTATGVGGPIISRHYDVIVLDDVVDEDNARSRLMRDRLGVWYYKELLPTLEPDGSLRVIGTRYHRDDLYGRLMADGFPALIERALRGEPGAERALWEEKFPLELLRRKREEAGPALFNTQYQNDVSTMDGAVFRPEWIATRDAPRGGRRFQGVDLAMGSEERHDYFAHVTVVERRPGVYHVLDVRRARLSFEEQFRAVCSLHGVHDTPEGPVVAVGVEANGYQDALVQRLRSDSPVPVRAIRQTRDKLARAMTLQGLVETGRLTFPQSGASDLVEELLAFPDGDHDDMVDALEIAVRLAREVSSYAELPALSAVYPD